MRKDVGTRKDRQHGDVTGSVRIEARVWLNAVRIATGFGYTGMARAFSEGAIGKHLTFKEARTLSTTWKRYGAGARMPEADTIRRVENACPGTAVWLELPLWAALSQEELNLSDLKGLLHGLRPEVRRIIFHTEAGLRSPLFKDASRRRPLDRVKSDRLGKLGLSGLGSVPRDALLYLDSLTCAVALMREARLVENDGHHFLANRSKLLLEGGLDRIPEVAPFKHQILHRIYEVSGEANYILDWPDAEEDLNHIARKGASVKRGKKKSS